MKSYISRFEIFNETIVYSDFEPPTPKWGSKTQFMIRNKR
jgi:hypothetical protein